jgi:transcriptional regulator with XRE-family HTH domain
MALETESSLMANKEFNIRLGAVLRAHRQEKGFSQEYVAGLLGVSKNQVSHWEIGKRSMYAESLRSYCRILGVPMQKVLDEADEVVIYDAYL